MTRNDFIARVSSLLGREVDGDTVLLIDQYLPEVIKTVTRYIAEAKPQGHEFLLLKQQSLHAPLTPIITDEGQTFNLTSDFTYKFSYARKFQRVEIATDEFDDDRTFIAYPVNTMLSLRLCDAYGVPLYYVDGVLLHFKLPDSFDGGLVGTYVTHYPFYDVIDNVPVQLADFFTKEMVRIISQEKVRQEMDNKQP